MRVGVVMPLYRQDPEYLRLALESMAQQEFKEFQLVVVSDGADAATLEAVQPWTSRLPMKIVLRQENRGVAHSLNEGFAHLQNAEYWTWISNDNIYDPPFLRVLVESLDSCPPGVGLVYSAYRIIDPAGRRLSGPPFDQRQPREKLLDFCFIGPSFLYRRSAAQAAGPYDPFFDPVQDYEFWLRLTEVCDIRHVPEELMSYRIHHPFSVTTQVYANPVHDRIRREKAGLAVTRARLRRGLGPKGGEMG